MDLGFYFSSPLKMGMEIPELYGSGEGKIRPAPLPFLSQMFQDHILKETPHLYPNIKALG
jgi:hypothetical protein